MLPSSTSASPTIDQQRFEQDAASAYRALRAGGLVLLPTDVGYGLVAMQDSAVEQIYQLKGRPLSKPCVTVANGPIFDRLVRGVAPGVRDWLGGIRAHSPIAAITELDADSRLLASLSPYVRDQATHDGTIATFHSAGRFVVRVAELALADDLLVVGSSANLAGTGNNYAFESVPESMRRAAALIIDHGTARYVNDRKLASTILDVRTGTFVRRGIHFAEIERSWREYLEHQGRYVADRPV
jgi:tRNA A37 threonylcarbamoyladenosine synthetase subunit TsaC/SUA5/YrdC